MRMPAMPPRGVKPDTARFFFGTPSHKVVSRYARLEFVDGRADTATIGMITTSTRYDIQVVPGWPLGEQFGSLFSAMTDSVAGDHSLGRALSTLPGDHALPPAFTFPIVPLPCRSRTIPGYYVAAGPGFWPDGEEEILIEVGLLGRKFCSCKADLRRLPGRRAPDIQCGQPVMDLVLRVVGEWIDW